jgi:hypothetical protein
VSQQPASAGFRRIAGRETPVVQIDLQPPAPARFRATLAFRVSIALAQTDPFGLRLEALGSSDHLDIRESDMTPAVSESLKLRLEGWVQRHLADLLTQLEATTLASRAISGIGDAAARRARRHRPSLQRGEQDPESRRSQ